MNWVKFRSIGVGVACATVVFVHAPPILVDPLKTALTQMRVNTATSEPTESGTASVSDAVLGAVKKILK